MPEMTRPTVHSMLVFLNYESMGEKMHVNASLGRKCRGANSYILPFFLPSYEKKCCCNCLVESANVKLMFPTAFNSFNSLLVLARWTLGKAEKLSGTCGQAER